MDETLPGDERAPRRSTPRREPSAAAPDYDPPLLLLGSGGDYRRAIDWGALFPSPLTPQNRPATAWLERVVRRVLRTASRWIGVSGKPVDRT